MPDHSVRLALVRRSRAARRLPVLSDRHGSSLAAWDPLLPWPIEPRQPPTYGLTGAELQREASRLRAGGWAPEIAATLVRPTVVA